MNEVLPSVITSVATTLVTLLVVWFTSKASREIANRREPLVLRRARGTNWQIFSRHRKTVTGVSHLICSKTGEYREDGYLPDGRLEPEGMIHIHRLDEGDQVIVSWDEVRCFDRRTKTLRSEVRIKDEIDEYPFRRTTNIVTNGGGR